MPPRFGALVDAPLAGALTASQGQEHLRSQVVCIRRPVTPRNKQQTAPQLPLSVEIEHHTWKEFYFSIKGKEFR